MKSVLDITILQLAIAYIFIIILLIIVRARGIKREKEILLASVRMTIQLTLTGYVLLYVFNHPNPFITILAISIMIGFAIFTAIKRSKYKLSRELMLIIILSMAIGSLITIFFFILMVIQVKPWFNPQYFIPITGMIVGNSMTGISLGINKLCGDMKDKRSMIENSLMLGATPKASVKDIVNNAFDSAIIPTINTMIGMGIISLPGMMTGQILSGTLPVTAIKYQIGIMLAILGGLSITLIIFVSLGYRTFFNKNEQLL